MKTNKLIDYAKIGAKGFVVSIISGLIAGFFYWGARQIDMTLIAYLIGFIGIAVSLISWGWLAKTFWGWK